MAATITKHETIIVQTEFEVPAPKIDAPELSPAEPIPWYRRVPAPGLTTSRHWSG